MNSRLMMKINAYDILVSPSYAPSSRQHTCNPYVTPNMMIEINGNELLPVATATIRYASYTTASTHQDPSHTSPTHINDSSRKNLHQRQQHSTQDQKTHTIVPNKSINTKNRIEKQQKPHNSGKITNSNKLCTVELIHRRR